MNMILNLIILSILLTLVSIPFGILFSTTNHIQNVQHTSMKFDIKSIFSALVVAAITSCTLYYLIIVSKGTPYQAFLLGSIMTAYSEFTTTLLFKDYPLYVAIINSVAGGCIFVCTTLVYNTIM